MSDNDRIEISIATSTHAFIQGNAQQLRIKTRRERLVQFLSEISLNGAFGFRPGYTSSAINDYMEEAYITAKEEGYLVQGRLTPANGWRIEPYYVSRKGQGFLAGNGGVVTPHRWATLHNFDVASQIADLIVLAAELTCLGGDLVRLNFGGIPPYSVQDLLDLQHRLDYLKQLPIPAALAQVARDAWSALQCIHTDESGQASRHCLEAARSTVRDLWSCYRHLYPLGRAVHTYQGEVHHKQEGDRDIVSVSLPILKTDYRQWTTWTVNEGTV